MITVFDPATSPEMAAWRIGNKTRRTGLRNDRAR